MQIDHINGNPNDNRIENLRHVSNAINSENLRNARADSKTGLLGSHYHKASKSYVAQIQVKGRKKHLGCFETPELASAAYIDAKRKFHKGCTL